MYHGFGCLINCLVLPFHNPILLRVVGNCELPLNSCFFAEIIEFCRGVFSTIVWSQNLNPSSWQILDLCFEFFEIAKYFLRFLGLEKVYPILLWVVFNKCYIIVVATQWSNNHGSTPIGVHWIQYSFKYALTIREGSLGILSKCTPLKILSWSIWSSDRPVTIFLDVERAL